jgi:hypothetical protein
MTKGLLQPHCIKIDKTSGKDYLVAGFYIYLLCQIPTTTFLAPTTTNPVGNLAKNLRQSRSPSSPTLTR